MVWMLLIPSFHDAAILPELPDMCIIEVLISSTSSLKLQGIAFNISFVMVDKIRLLKQKLYLYISLVVVNLTTV